MNEKILIKNLSKNIKKELKSIHFSENYIDLAKSKYEILSYKIFDLKPAEANILKQTCLSLGFDSAINRDAVTCKCEFSDAIICGSKYQLENLCGKLKKQPFRLKKIANFLEEKINPPKNYNISNETFDYKKTYLMGILNVTPDSFSDGGKSLNLSDAIANAEEMIKNGANIIDIGGESTRQNAVPISSEEECNRILPVISELKKRFPQIIISVDTIHPETFLEALKLGADILNNVGNIELFESVFDVLKERKIPIIITHSNGIPAKIEKKDFDGDIVEEIYKFFSNKEKYLKDKGLTENLFIFDVGIGFGKSVNDQFELIKRADEFSSLNYPIMYGISKKSFISETFGKENINEITEIYSQHLISKGVNIIRVHDIKKHSKLIKYLEKIF